MLAGLYQLSVIGVACSTVHTSCFATIATDTGLLCCDAHCCCLLHRQLNDVGRSVSAFGYWGDVLNSPFHAFGTIANDPGLFKVTNKQFMHTAVDVAEHNLLVRIHAIVCCLLSMMVQLTIGPKA